MQIRFKNKFFLFSVATAFSSVALMVLNFFLVKLSQPGIFDLRRYIDMLHLLTTRYFFSAERMIRILPGAIYISMILANLLLFLCFAAAVAAIVLLLAKKLEPVECAVAVGLNAIVPLVVMFAF